MSDRQDKVEYPEAGTLGKYPEYVIALRTQLNKLPAHDNVKSFFIRLTKQNGKSPKEPLNLATTAAEFFDHHCVSPDPENKEVQLDPDRMDLKQFLKNCNAAERKTFQHMSYEKAKLTGRRNFLKKAGATAAGVVSFGVGTKMKWDAAEDVETSFTHDPDAPAFETREIDGKKKKVITQLEDDPLEIASKPENMQLRKEAETTIKNANTLQLWSGIPLSYAGIQHAYDTVQTMLARHKHVESGELNRDVGNMLSQLDTFLERASKAYAQKMQANEKGR